MVEKNLCGHQNFEETSSGNVRRGDPCNTMGVDLFAMGDKRYMTGV